VSKYRGFLQRKKDLEKSLRELRLEWEGFLINTNILIYYLADAIPEDEIPRIEKILKEDFNISIITKIEFLGRKGHTSEGFEKSREFISFARVIPLTDDIAELAIELRRRKSIKLPML